MKTDSIGRRNMLAMSAGTRLNPGGAAAQAVGVKTGDLPNLTIREVQVYVVDPGQPGMAVTNSGLEGNYTLARRYWHPNWSNEGWLEFAKRTLVGRSVLSQSAGLIRAYTGSLSPLGLPV